MTRRGFHILLALVLVVCVLSPYVEFALHWDQTIFDTGYDGESTVAVIALLLVLAFLIASLLAHFISDTAAAESLVGSRVILRRAARHFIFAVPEVSPPLLALRI
jgi:small-conductance mechanosensitive channel